MIDHFWTRRHILQTGAALASAGLAWPIGAKSLPAEVDLVDEPTRGYYGDYDVTNFGPAALRKAKRDFVFPSEVDVPFGYGIDISHHSKEVPWHALKDAKVSYVYIKASQGQNGRDGKFVEFWKAAKASTLPFGAYHFLTAGVPGETQAAFFLKRLAEVGHIQKGHLQPVLDLEWDIFGPTFKRVVVGKSAMGDPLYKDYWDGLSKSAIVATVNAWVAVMLAAAGPLKIKPVIYTNRSWWEAHVPAGTVFPHCTIWISDYRQQSFANNAPRSVQGHEYHLWQFTDRAHIQTGGKNYGPFDSNKLLSDSIQTLIIT